MPQASWNAGRRGVELIFFSFGHSRAMRPVSAFTCLNNCGRRASISHAIPWSRTDDGSG